MLLFIPPAVERCAGGFFLRQFILVDFLFLTYSGRHYIAQYMIEPNASTYIFFAKSKNKQYCLLLFVYFIYICKS